MEVGSVVTLRMEMLGEDTHAIGVVFHKYDGGVQIIFERGGYDGFSDDEQRSYLMVRGIDEKSKSYQFKNVMQVSSDYEKHIWDHVFEDSKYRVNRHF